MANLAYAFIPAANGRVDTTNPCTLTIDADTNSNKYVAQFAHGATGMLHFAILTPPNYTAGGATIRIRWRSPVAITGNVYWECLWSYITNGGTTPVGSTGVIGITAVAGTAGDTVESDFSLSALIANSILVFTIERVGANASDTSTGIAELLDISLEYACDPTQQQAYVWVPAQAFSLPPASGAVISNVAMTTATYPYCVNLRHANSDYIDCDLVLPSSYNGGFLATTAWVNAATGNVTLRQDMAVAAIGGASDPALTVGTQFTFVGSGAADFNVDLKRATAVAPAATNSVNLRFWRLGSDAGDTSTGVTQLLGILYTFNTTTRNPAWIIMDPLVGAQATSTVVLDNDTNLTKYVLQMPQSVASLGDFIGRTPSIWAAGGSVYVRWRSTGTGNAYLRVDAGFAAVGALGDPALTAGTAVAVTNAGSNLINETVFSVTGAAASEDLVVRVNRLGTSGSDTLTGTVEILDIRFVFNLA